MESPEVTLIVPTLNEAANLPLLAERIHRTMRWRPYELLIVDDQSTDGTQAAGLRLADRYPIRLIVRRQPTCGLSGAVLHGMESATGELLVVMDADLQHPPEAIPRLLAPLEAGEADFVIGSRYIDGGSIDGRWTLLRRLNSALATLLARPIAGRTHDPMSGFFALRHSTWQSAQHLTPMGYKIGLELICKCSVRRIVEVPIQFAQRAHGSSKLSMKEQLRYAQHLARLYRFMLNSRIARPDVLAIAHSVVPPTPSSAVAPPVRTPAAQVDRRPANSQKLRRAA